MKKTAEHSGNEFQSTNSGAMEIPLYLGQLNLELRPIPMDWKNSVISHFRPRIQEAWEVPGKWSEIPLPRVYGSYCGILRSKLMWSLEALAFHPTGEAPNLC